LANLLSWTAVSAGNDKDGANLSLMTIARRGTKQAIAEVRNLLAQRTMVH